MSVAPQPDWDALLAAAFAVRARAHAPYSRFLVGAALLGDDGQIHVGCNVENASFGATVCAERNAVGALIAAGAKRALACAVVTSGTPASPCGLCRQVLAEFAEDLPIVLAPAEDLTQRTMLQLSELLPRAFRGGALPV